MDDEPGIRRPGKLSRRRYFGDGWLDGQPAIIVDYGQAGDPLDLLFRDEIRMVQPGVYLGIGWRNREQPPWTKGRTERVTFVLDLVHPELSASDCPHCQVRLRHTPSEECHGTQPPP